MVVVPADTPVTTPDAEPTVAMAGVLLLQVPPVVTSVRGVVNPTQTEWEPAIAAGAGFTVMVWLTG